jgi:hypothetical protein
MSGGGGLERRRWAGLSGHHPKGESMSDFVFLFRSTEADASQAMATAERAQQSMQAWLGWIRRLEAGGHLKDPGQPLLRTGKVVKGKGLVVDGPFAEAKDIVLGFLVVHARDLAHALLLAEDCPLVEGGGSVEIRPVADMPS